MTKNKSDRKYCFNTLTKEWIGIDSIYVLQENEEFRPESEFKVYHEAMMVGINAANDLNKKKLECRNLILSRYSETDQTNMMGTVSYEREFMGGVTKETKAMAKTMYDFIKSVQDEFRSKGIDADFSRFAQ